MARPSVNRYSWHRGLHSPHCGGALPVESRLGNESTFTLLLLLEDQL